MTDFPVPVKHKNRFPDDIRELIKMNDAPSWNVAEAWLNECDRWTPYCRRPGVEASPGHGLVLRGPVGTGKTTIAAAWLNDIARDTKFTVAFLNDAKLAALLRQQHRDDEAATAVHFLQRVGFLVVDDLMRMGTHTIPLEVEGFLRSREDNGWPTIITLNPQVKLPTTLGSLLTTWAWALFEGEDLRDPDNVERLTA